ncbi:hypothetical protein OO010_01605 [Flavobacteriaceae bacterium KMM 6898]|nr:hypothetical protein [Flavobacteriaceae bacterium KMM 6898]
MTGCLKKGKLEKEGHPILLIDNFIGTGETAIETLKEIIALKGYDNKTLFIATLVCQKEGLKVINDYNVLFEVLRDKGISNKYFGEELIENESIMKSIEEILSIDSKFEDKFRFGYKSSQALVTMNRTPNNTFPMFWFQAKLGKGEKLNAPFPR